MFTGLISGIGKIVSISPFSGGRKISVKWNGFADSAIDEGDSTAIDGVCLSLEKIDADVGHFIAVEETISRTTLAKMKAGDSVDIELPATMSTLLHGHIVQGHIDCIGKIVSLENAGAQQMLKIEHRFDFSRYVVEKGSVAVNGISLTVASCGDGWFECAIIPETMKRTALQFKSAQDEVNIEFDILAKYIESLIENKNRGSNYDDMAAIY